MMHEGDRLSVSVALTQKRACHSFLLATVLTEGLTLSMVKAIMSARGDEIGFGLKGCGGAR
jgi:hypothetical protein